MKIILAQPRGFCAGVDRAISIVEKALEKHGKPIYVRHEIVHNKTVVSDLRQKGAIFIEEIDDVPDNSVVIFSAHGVPKRVMEQSEERELLAIDATCPLVKKVHSAVQNHERQATTVILIGHEGHPEVEGTMGQLPKGKVKLVGSVEDVQNLSVDMDDSLAYTTQTTLSMDETVDIIQALKEKYPNIKGPDKGDLCYATTNRQKAVSQIVPMVDLFLIVGSANSSNSNRLRELGEEGGIPSYLIDEAKDLQTEWFENVKSVGISSGASAPEILVQGVLSWIKENFPDSESEEYVLLEEDVHFPIPKELRA